MCIDFEFNVSNFLFGDFVVEPKFFNQMLLIFLLEYFLFTRFTYNFYVLHFGLSPFQLDAEA